MATMEKVTDKNYPFHLLLRQNIDIVIKAVEKRWDGLLLYDGVEGSGKTTFGSQVSYYQAWKSKTSFNLDNVVFTAEQFNDAVTNLNPKTPILWDEAVFGALASEWASIINRTITKLLVTIRKKQLYINIVVPWFYMLQPYLAVGRTRALLHTVTPDGISRGYFRLYDYQAKQQLYFKNKKYYTYFGVKPAFDGTFTNTTGLFYNEKEYEQKKDDAIKSIMEASEKQPSKSKQAIGQRDILIRELVNYKKRKDIANLVGLTYGQINNILKDI